MANESEEVKGSVVFRRLRDMADEEIKEEFIRVPMVLSQTTSRDGFVRYGCSVTLAEGLSIRLSLDEGTFYYILRMREKLLVRGQVTLMVSCRIVTGRSADRLTGELRDWFFYEIVPVLKTRQPYLHGFFRGGALLMLSSFPALRDTLRIVDRGVVTNDDELSDDEYQLKD